MAATITNLTGLEEAEAGQEMDAAQADVLKFCELMGWDVPTRGAAGWEFDEFLLEPWRGRISSSLLTQDLATMHEGTVWVIGAVATSPATLEEPEDSDIIELYRGVSLRDALRELARMKLDAQLDYAMEHMSQPEF